VRFIIGSKNQNLFEAVMIDDDEERPEWDWLKKKSKS
jgi:hypothetical protein